MATINIATQRNVQQHIAKQSNVKDQRVKKSESKKTSESYKCLQYTEYIMKMLRKGHRYTVVGSEIYISKCIQCTEQYTVYMLQKGHRFRAVGSEIYIYT